MPSEEGGHQFEHEDEGLLDAMEGIQFETGAGEHGSKALFQEYLDTINNASEVEQQMSEPQAKGPRGYVLLYHRKVHSLI
jgi:hypothetical protein